MLRIAWNFLVARLLRLLPLAMLKRVTDELLRLRHRSQEELRRRRAAVEREVLPAIVDVTGGRLERFVLEKPEPWRAIKPQPVNIPGMLTEAEKSYYLYITRFYTGIGAVVEVGPWLGLSTHFIVTGLMSNPQFEEERVYVFDDFTWRSSWMDKWLRGTEIPAPPNHSSFLHLFEQQVASLLDRVVVRQCKLCDADGNEGLPLIRWSGGPIELIIVDCGRTLQVNEAWWTEFNQSFIANRTLIIMQDWQNHKRVPELFWENTRLFTDSKGDALDLIHEVRDAAIATFLYRGTGN